MNSYPAPWQLTGYGYILLYSLGKERINALAPDFLKGKALPSLGSVMLVNYERSDCGPYGELLLIPGSYEHESKFKGINRDHFNTISKIYVSTQDSIDNGIQNWAIPKELAYFDFTPFGKNQEKVRVSTLTNEKKTPILEATFKSHPIPFPVHTALLPFPLVQEHEGREYYTKFSGKGIGHLCSMTDVTIHPHFFPDLTDTKPIAIIKVDPFHITFPKAILS